MQSYEQSVCLSSFDFVSSMYDFYYSDRNINTTQHTELNNYLNFPEIVFFHLLIFLYILKYKKYMQIDLGIIRYT